ncbi:MAG: hypothetical protein ACM3IL_00665, partial [Deltaproteobacteria bacterium]
MITKKIFKVGYAGILFISLLFVALFFWDTVFAQMPQEVFLQARVTKKDKSALSGTHRFTFRLYPTDSGGTSVWSESQDLPVDDLGIISCYLGSSTVFPETLDFNTPMHLSIEVDEEGEMSPRLKIVPAACALNSYRLDGVEPNKFLRSDIPATMDYPFTLNSYFAQNYSGTGHDAININYTPAVTSTNSVLNVNAGANATGPLLKFSQGGSGAFIEAQAGAVTRFQVDADGNATLAGVPYIWPATQGAASTFLFND